MRTAETSEAECLRFITLLYFLGARLGLKKASMVSLSRGHLRRSLLLQCMFRHGQFRRRLLPRSTLGQSCPVTAGEGQEPVGEGDIEVRSLRQIRRLALG